MNNTYNSKGLSRFLPITNAKDFLLFWLYPCFSLYTYNTNTLSHPITYNPIPTEMSFPKIEPLRITQPTPTKTEPAKVVSLPPKICKDWSNTIADFRTFFSGCNLPPQIRISVCEVVTDPGRFVESHLAILEANPNKEFAQSYLYNLERLRNETKA
jgi:hypothetical protein